MKSKAARAQSFFQVGARAWGFILIHSRNSQEHHVSAAILIGNWPVAKLCMARRSKVKSCQGKRPVEGIVEREDLIK